MKDCVFLSNYLKIKLQEFVKSDESDFYRRDLLPSAMIKGGEISHFVQLFVIVARSDKVLL